MNAEETTLVMPQIALWRCTGCGLCQHLCPAKAVEVQNKLAVITKPEVCTFCDICETSPLSLPPISRLVSLKGMSYENVVPFQSRDDHLAGGY